MASEAKLDMDLADVVKADRKLKKNQPAKPAAKGAAAKQGGVKVGKGKGKASKVVRDPNMTKLQQQAKKIRQQKGKGAKGDSQPVVAAVMKRAAQAKLKIQQSKDARKSKVAQARGIVLQNPRKGNKSQIVKLQPSKTQKQPFVFRGGSRGQGRGGVQNQVPRRKNTQARGQGQGRIRVVVSEKPGQAAGGRGQNRQRGRGARGRGFYGGNQTAQRQQIQVQQRKMQVAQARRQNVNQRRGLIQPYAVQNVSQVQNNRGGRGRGRGFGGNRGGFRGGAPRARGGGGGGGGGNGVIRIVRR